MVTKLLLKITDGRLLFYDFFQRRENAKSRTSMREKLVEKQKAVDEHESNFTAGRVNVRERYLHRTGIRGRKSWIFFAVLYILTLIVIVNLVVSTCRWTKFKLNIFKHNL